MPVVYVQGLKFHFCVHSLETGDNLSFYNFGMKMRCLYDTSLAYKIIQYQNHGIPYHGSDMISFNNICREYGMVTNPLKDRFDGYKWVRLNDKFFSTKKLDMNLIVYCAYDVVPLIDLYNLTTGVRIKKLSSYLSI